MDDIEHIDDLLEEKGMLAERIESWFADATRKGVLQGTQQGIQLVMQHGIQLGMQQGMRQGEARILGRLLEQRFGPLSSLTFERLADASQSELETWSGTALTAPTLEAVFKTLH